MTNRELELWNKIEEFQFDKPNVRLTFAKRLAKENGISEQFANEIVDEYRKFIFLCCVSKQQMSPSHFVDLAWHLHLTYTKSYWLELCKNTIGRDLHHEPTEGGKEEDEKFKTLYKNTLDLYEPYFLSKPPEKVWPKDNKAPANSNADKSRHWLIPKPAFSLRGHLGLLAMVAIGFVALLLGCSSDPGSLGIIILVVLFLGAIIFVIARNNRRGSSNCSSGCGSGCGGIFGSSGCGDGGGDGGGSGCSSGCSGGCGGGGD